MSQFIQLKRGLKSALANVTTARQGEPFFTVDTKELFVGNAQGTVDKITDIHYGAVAPQETHKLWIAEVNGKFFIRKHNGSEWVDVYGADVIDDLNVSVETTFSSQKIMDLFAGFVTANEFEEGQTAQSAKNAEQDGRINELETDVANHETRIGSVEGEVTGARGAHIDLDARLDEIEASVLTETNRAAAAEQGNLDAIVAEGVRAEAKEVELNQAILDEKARAEGVEATLRSDLDAEVLRAKAREDGIAGTVSDNKTAFDNFKTAANAEFQSLNNKDVVQDAEIIALKNKDSEIEGTLNAVKGEVEGARSSMAKSADGTAPKVFASVDARLEELESEAKTEKERAIAEEQRVEGKFNGEVSRLDSVDADLQAQIDAMGEGGGEKDASQDVLIEGLRTDLNAETNARVAKDLEHDGKLEQEAINRVAAVQAVQDNLDTHEADFVAFQGEMDTELAKKVDKTALGVTVATLENGLVPMSQLPPEVKNNIRVVADLVERDALVGAGILEGTRVHVRDASADSSVESGWAEYLFDGTDFHKTAEHESIDVIQSWENILGRPTSPVADIDDAVAKKHVHDNKVLLDQIVAAGNEGKMLMIGEDGNMKFVSGIDGGSF